jgi:hypothetical protein
VTLDLRRPTSSSKIEALKARLIVEMERDKHVDAIVEELQHYHTRRRPLDGIEGLEAKLLAADRETELLDAMEQKERFSKLLLKWSLYASAQEIFVHLLSLAVHEFQMSIQPLIGDLDRLSYNTVVTQRIIRPLMDEVGDCPLSLDALVTMGLYYWLAEQCFVRWHA